MCYLFNLCGMIEEFIVKDCMSKYFVECQNVMKVSFWGEMSPRSAYGGGRFFAEPTVVTHNDPQMKLPNMISYK